MPSKRVTIEKLFKKLEKLFLRDEPELLNNLRRLGPCNKFKTWTPLKLIGLLYVLNPYLTIVNKALKQNYRDIQIFYIDLFSGSGLNEVSSNKMGKQPVMIGSPLVAIETACNSPCRFDLMFFNDADESCCDALRERLAYLEKFEKYSWIKGKWKVLNLDVNKAVDSILSELPKFANSFLFVDPYKWEIEWSQLEKILRLNGDALIIHQAKLIAKEIGRKSNLTPDVRAKIENYLGEKIENLTGSEEDVKSKYIGKIKSIKGYVNPVLVKKTGGESNFRYYLIFATKKENPPWKDVVEGMKQLVESTSGEDVETCLLRKIGEQPWLEDF